MSSNGEPGLSDRIAAITIVNNAVIRCQLLGLPVNHDNVILCIGDHFDPNDLSFSGVIVEIERALNATLGVASAFN